MRTGPTPSDNTSDPLESAFARDRARLWGLCYRMTGSGADADEIVQETFVRALEKRPDASRSLTPWLFRVATNLARDRLRLRKSRAYIGPWLPEPIETAEMAFDQLPDARYQQKESLTFAFLVALEALTPKQRAVLLLRDVYELSGRETADAVGTSEGNVKVLLHRARAAMARHDASRVVPSPERNAQTQQALMAFLTALASGDAAAMTAALSEDIVMANDGGGEFSAARKLVVGRARVVRFHLKVSEPGVPQVRLTELNGVPGLIVRRPPAPEKPPPRGRGPRQPVARRVVILVDGGETLTHLWSVLATPKLAGLSFPGFEPAVPG